ncbi:MAG: M16 family metallopeptidase [Vicinamibacterales bacterium]
MALDPRHRLLDNGVTVVVQANRLIPAVSIAVGVRAGAIADPPESPGLATLTARVLDRGTVALDADAIADRIEGRGASLGAAAGRQQLVVSATCLSADLAAILPVVADVVRMPSFPDPDVATRRGELLTEILEAEDDPGAVAVDALLGVLYPEPHPLGRPVRGRGSAVAALGRDALVAFHRRWVVPAATTVVAVGDLDPPDALDRLAAAFADWEPAETALPVVQPELPSPLRERRVVRRPMPDKSQADVAYGFIGLARHDPDYYAALVMNNALGQYGLGGRLGDSIRERQGMAYYVFSNLEAGLSAGPLMIRAGVAAANVGRAIASIDEELRLVTTDGFPRADIDDAKLYLTGSLPRQLETNAGIAGFLLSAQLHGLGIDHDVRLPALIAAVSHDDVARVTTRLLDPTRAAIAVAGPLTDEAP